MVKFTNAMKSTGRDIASIYIFTNRGIILFVAIYYYYAELLSTTTEGTAYSCRPPRCNLNTTQFETVQKKEMQRYVQGNPMNPTRQRVQNVYIYIYIYIYIK
jgi:hypothetical protein